jgi:archaellum biogenesis ATPase FlaH
VQLGSIPALLSQTCQNFSDSDSLMKVVRNEKSRMILKFYESVKKFVQLKKVYIQKCSQTKGQLSKFRFDLICYFELA